MRIILIVTLAMIIGCSSCKTEQKPNGKKPEIKIKVGWIDPDTYSVSVTGTDEKTAFSKAKHKILKDIVKVRIQNQSRYTDITKIQDEFRKPLKNGKVIKKISSDSGLKIVFQIRDKGLKKKFERK